MIPAQRTAPRGLFDGDATLHVLDLETEELVELANGLVPHEPLHLSADRNTLLYRSGATWYVRDVSDSAIAKPVPLDLEGVQIDVDPHAEWQQIYREAWRTMRDYFYDPDFNGLDLDATQRRYARYLDKLAGRDDLNYLIETAFGELGVSHIIVRGGDRPVVNFDRGIRYADWMEENRRLVDELSGGRLGYLHIFSTGRMAYPLFNRYLYAQQDREGLIIDIRGNSGGSTAEYVIDQLRRTPLSQEVTRHGSWPVPAAALAGPRVMLIDEDVASGGERLAFAFRATGLGPLVGTQTSGAGVGVLHIGSPRHVDGGYSSAPSMAPIGLDGDMVIEGVVVAPDLKVVVDDAQWRAGGDPQLERAVEEALRVLGLIDSN